MKKRIIIFSSAENLSLAEAIQSMFYYKDYIVTLWTNNFFEISKPYISNFSDIRTDYDFAVILYSGDDKIKKRNKSYSIARDNVILELGMCISSFSLNRVIIVKNEHVNLPSDLDGIQPINYSFNNDDNVNAVAGMIYSEINKYITYNCKDLTKSYIKLSWDEYFFYVQKLFDLLSRSSAMGGFYFDVIVGISGGGLMVADILSREYGQIKPVVSLIADRRKRRTRFDFDDMPFNNEGALFLLDNEKIKSILLIDSFTRDGITIFEAKKYLENNLKNKTIKTAVIYASEKLKNNKKIDKIDFVATYKDLVNKKLSINGY